MRRFSRYVYNEKTLMYELHSDSKWTVAAKLLGFAAVVLLFSAAYFFFYTKVLCLDLPKTARLKKENAQWVAKFKMLDHEMDLVEALVAMALLPETSLCKASILADFVPM